MSAELLFEDVRRQLIAVHEVLTPPPILAVLVPLPTAPAVRERLATLLHPRWTARWRKAPPKQRAGPPPERKTGHHNSAHRLMQEYRTQQKQETKRGK